MPKTTDGYLGKNFSFNRTLVLSPLRKRKNYIFVRFVQITFFVHLLFRKNPLSFDAVFQLVKFSAFNKLDNRIEHFKWTIHKPGKVKVGILYHFQELSDILKLDLPGAGCVLCYNKPGMLQGWNDF